MIHEEDLGHPSKTKFYMYIRKDIKSVLQDLIKSPEANLLNFALALPSPLKVLGA